MQWFFDNDHLLTVTNVEDDKGEIITDATVTVQISDKENNEILNQNMNPDGSGNYSLALADDTISENYEYYHVKITAEKNAVKGTWVDSIKSQNRYF